MIRLTIAEQGSNHNDAVRIILNRVAEAIGCSAGESELAWDGRLLDERPSKRARRRLAGALPNFSVGLMLAVTFCAGTKEEITDGDQSDSTIYRL